MPIVSERSARCSACPAVKSGPCIDTVRTARDIMFIGEAPSARETARPFTGRIGADFNIVLLGRILGRDRDAVWFTNSVKCAEARDERNNSIPNALLSACAEKWLPREIDACAPKLIVLMGANAVKNWRMQSGAKFDVDLHHGFEYMAYPVWDTSDVRRVFITLHPSSGSHNTAMLHYIYEDFEALRKVVRGGKHVAPCDEYAGREDYSECMSEYDLEAYLDRGHEAALDTETQENPSDEHDDGRTPLFVQVSTVVGSGRLIDATNQKLLRVLHKAVQHKHVLMHNALFDLDVLERCSVIVDRFTDTMEQAFALQLERQSLKILGYRLCGMSMTEYDDVVRTPHAMLMEDWFQSAAPHVPLNKSATKKQRAEHAEFVAQWEAENGRTLKYFARPDAVTKLDGSTYQAQGVGTKIKRALSDYEKDSTVDLRDRLKSWEREQQREVEALIGRAPAYDLTIVPRKRAVRYACRDTDATLRVYFQLRLLERALIERVPAKNHKDYPANDYDWLFDCVPF